MASMATLSIRTRQSIAQNASDNALLSTSSQLYSIQFKRPSAPSFFPNNARSQDVWPRTYRQAVFS